MLSEKTARVKLEQFEQLARWREGKVYSRELGPQTLFVCSLSPGLASYEYGNVSVTKCTALDLVRKWST